MRTIQESPPRHNGDGQDEDVVLVLTTWPDDAHAADVARHIVEARLAACVTRLPRHRVVYRWEGAIEEAEEHQWVIKTTRGALDALWRAVRAAHPYRTPEWVAITAAGGSDDYLHWVRTCTSPDA